MNFLSFYFGTSEKHNFISISKIVPRFSAAYELQSTALDPDYSLFICYQMPVDKHKSLNTCLCLLRKSMNNFAELSASDLPIT